MCFPLFICLFGVGFLSVQEKPDVIPALLALWITIFSFSFQGADFHFIFLITYINIFFESHLKSFLADILFFRCQGLNSEPCSIPDTGKCSATELNAQPLNHFWKEEETLLLLSCILLWCQFLMTATLGT